MSEIYLSLLRVGTWTQRDLANAERGILKVMDGERMTAVFSTIENAVSLNRSSLRVGIYELEHSRKEYYLDGTPMAKPINCLRPTDDRIRKILIHRAFKDDPKTLIGCIAPGTFGTLDFQDSEAAMAKLFEALGSFQEGRRVSLKVLSNATGIGLDTKQTWSRTR